MFFFLLASLQRPLMNVRKAVLVRRLCLYKYSLDFLVLIYFLIAIDSKSSKQFASRVSFDYDLLDLSLRTFDCYCKCAVVIKSIVLPYSILLC